MRKVYSISSRSKMGLWLIALTLFSFWLILILTSSNPLDLIFPDTLMLAAVCAIAPLLAHFVYVVIDDEQITVPTAIFFRHSIPIRSIRALHYKLSGLGFVKGIQIEYVDNRGTSRTAILPSITTFGVKRTSEMVHSLKEVNLGIKVDPNIAKFLQT